MNRPAKGFTPDRAFFAIRAQADGAEAVTRCLEGVIDREDYEEASGCMVPNHGLPRFRECTFSTAYPLAQIELADKAVPVKVRLEAFNPLVPGDADASGVPVAVMRYVVSNPTKTAVAVSIAGTLPNIVGHDGSFGAPNENVNRKRKAGDVRGIAMSSDGVCEEAPQWGTMALAVLGEDDVSFCESWHETGWRTDLLAFWDDFSDDGRLEAVKGDAPANAMRRGSVAASVRLKPGESRAITFLLTWHFPNRLTWAPQPAPEGASCHPDDLVGNFYTTQYRDAWDVAVKTAKALPELEARTVEFVGSFCDSDLPEAVREAALFNLSTLRTQTCFRTPDGRFFGWEGCSNRGGCCAGTCTHVWNYEQATAFLFGDLTMTMRDVEFMHATDDRGLMSFRVGLPLETRAREFDLAAADGQMGCLMKLYRDWQLMKRRCAGCGLRRSGRWSSAGFPAAGMRIRTA